MPEESESLWEDAWRGMEQRLAWDILLSEKAMKQAIWDGRKGEGSGAAGELDVRQSGA